MGTASSVNLRGAEPLSFDDALKATRLSSHRETIAKTIGSQHPDVLEGLKDRITLLLQGNDEGASPKELTELMQQDTELKELLGRTSDEFMSLILSLLNATGEKAKTISVSQVVGLLSAPPYESADSGDDNIVQIVVDMDSVETEEVREHGSLRSAVTNYNESTRIINYVIDGSTDSPQTPRSTRAQELKRNRKASLSIGIDLESLGLDPTVYPVDVKSLTDDEAAVIIQKHYRGFVSRRATRMPPRSS